MSLHSCIARLIAQGVEPAEAGVIAAEIYAAGVASASVRSDGAERTRRWRARNRAENRTEKKAESRAESVTKRHAVTESDGDEVVSPDVTQRHQTSQSDALGGVHIESHIESKNAFYMQKADAGVTLRSSLTPLSRLPSSRADSPKTRLPPLWTPSLEEFAIARVEGLSEQDIARETIRFRNYWCGKVGRDGLKRDWTLVWRIWARNSARKFLPKLAAQLRAEAARDLIASEEAALPESGGARISLEDAVALYARSGVWSRHAPGGFPGEPSCRASPELLAKYGLAPDGRRA